YPFSRDEESPALVHAKSIFESRGNTPRLYRNTLLFLAADKVLLQDLEDATCKYLAWSSILNDKVAHNLDPQQVQQAQTQFENTNSVVNSRLPETYLWLLVPTQKSAQSPIIWEFLRLRGQEPLAERASKKLKNDSLLFTRWAPTLLRMELDRIPLWRGNHVPIKQLTEDFAQYPYLPRL